MNTSDSLHLSAYAAYCHVLKKESENMMYLSVEQMHGLNNQGELRFIERQ